MRKPNIVFIFSDQHRGDALGCTGHPAVKTPNLDRIASEGVAFTRCFVNGPVCLPSRSCMMTGQYVREHGVWTNSFVPDVQSSPSNVRNVRDAGYHTAQIGKTHLEDLKIWGFNDTFKLPGVHGSRSGETPYSEYLDELGLLETHRAYMTASKNRKEAGEGAPWDSPPCPLPSEAHLDSFCGRTAAEWIQSYRKDQPFYLQVLFPGPHDPFDSPTEYREMYDQDDMTDGIMHSPGEPIPPYVKRYLFRRNMSEMTVEQKKELLIRYYGKITLIDEAIGGIYKSLESTGQLDNTWIIYSSDHGEMAGDHRLGYKGVFYDASVHVPLVIRPPGGIEGWQSSGLTDVFDIVATILEVAGGGGLEGAESRSLLHQVIAGADDAGAQEGKGVVFSEVAGHTMVFDGRYKLVVEAYSEKPVEFYDVEVDPNELNNRADDPELESVRQGLIENHLSRIRDRMNVAKLELYRDST